MSTKHEPLLFTPGPLTTSRTVKQSMLRDVGSRDAGFIEVIAEIRQRLLRLAATSQADGYEAVLLQGSGTYAVESVISSIVPPGKKLLVAVNGAYGERMLQIAARHGIATVAVRFHEYEPVDSDAVAEALERDASIAMVAVVHCETTSGVLNPIEAIGEVVRPHTARFFVDSMSAFGALPVSVGAAAIDFLAASSNKCIEGVPGFAFVICRREALEAGRGCARTVSLDLLAQWEGLEANGQFRFTPPTHALLAFRQALDELEAEGGVAGRGERYRRCHRRLVDGMKHLGFRTYLPPELQAPIITSFRFPVDASFRFDEFYDRLRRRGFVIYPGKVSQADCFRIGNIGGLRENDFDALLAAIEAVLREMRVTMSQDS
jgi:2-aminoethylphosphonate-pyruvate transaminase